MVSVNVPDCNVEISGAWLAKTPNDPFSPRATSDETSPWKKVSTGVMMVR
jgi:hypothetical protein